MKIYSNDILYRKSLGLRLKEHTIRLNKHATVIRLSQKRLMYISNAKKRLKGSKTRHIVISTFRKILYITDQTSFVSSSSDLSPSSLSSPQPSASRARPRIPKLMIKPMNETAPKTPNARASPLGWILAVSEKSPPDRNGPTARPAADRVWARPLRAPKTAWFGAEFVT